MPGLGSMHAYYHDDKGNLICEYIDQVKIGDDSFAGPFIEKAKSVLAEKQKEIAEDDARQSLAKLLEAKLNG